MAPKRGPLDVEAGRRLVAAMEWRRITPSALAEQGEWERATVSRWRAGKVPDENNLRRLETILRVPRQWLKTGIGAMTDYTPAASPVRVVRESREALEHLAGGDRRMAERLGAVVRDLLALEAELLTPARLPVDAADGAAAVEEAATAPRSHGPARSRPA